MEQYLFDGFHKISEVETTIKGNPVKREKLHLKSAVAGVVIDENNRMALVTQYRPTIGQRTKEVPAGVLDKEGLTPLETLLEELDEECGVQKEDIISINEQAVHEYYMIAGSSDAKLSIFEIRVKAQKDKAVNDSEVESVEWATVEKVEQYLREGFIPDGKTIMSYYYFKSILSEKRESHVSSQQEK